MSNSKSRQPRSIANLLATGIDPIGCHVMTMAGKLGTVKAVLVEECEGLSQRLDVRHFNGEPWDYQPLPSLVYVIE